MFDSLLTVILAIVALGFIIFIHELGHYFAARWMGMKVEAFGIGFGQALFKWNLFSALKGLLMYFQLTWLTWLKV
jgi:regulator of sigma E protease